MEMGLLIVLTLLLLPQILYFLNKLFGHFELVAGEVLRRVLLALLCALESNQFYFPLIDPHQVQPTPLELLLTLVGYPN